MLFVHHAIPATEKPVISLTLLSICLCGYKNRCVRCLSPDRKMIINLSCVQSVLRLCLTCRLAIFIVMAKNYLYRYGITLSNPYLCEKQCWHERICGESVSLF